MKKILTLIFMLVFCSNAYAEWKFNPFTQKMDYYEAGGSQTPWTSNINADGYTLFGNNGSGENLTLQSTSHTTKGKILFGTSAYDEVNNWLGIGLTSPASRLSVLAGAADGAGTSAMGIGFQHDSSWTKAGIYADGSTGYGGILYFATNPGGQNHIVTPNMTILANGNVGIDTTNPKTKLQVGVGLTAADTAIAKFNTFDTNVAALELSNWDGGATTYGPRIHFDNSGVGTWYMGSSDGVNNFDIATTWGTPLLRIQSNGNVGIGTTTPDSRIHGVTTLSAATGNEIAYQLNYTTNKLTSGNDTGLLINQTDTASPGTSLLIDAQVGGWSKFKVFNTGVFYSLSYLWISTSNLYIGVNGSDIYMEGATNPKLSFSSTPSVGLVVAKTDTSTSGSAYGFSIKPIYNQASGTAANTDLLINRTETAVGSGAQLLIDAQVGGTTKFNVTNTGQGYFAGKVGIGMTPETKLDVVDDSINAGFRIRHSNLSQGISIGYNTILANGSGTNLDINITSKGTGAVKLSKTVLNPSAVTCVANVCTDVPASPSLDITTDATAGADVLTVADGTAGEIRIINLKTDGGTDLEVTPTNFANGTKITLDAAGDSAMIRFDGTKWHVLSTFGGVIQ